MNLGDLVDCLARSGRPLCLQLQAECKGMEKLPFPTYFDYRLEYIHISWLWEGIDYAFNVSYREIDAPGFVWHIVRAGGRFQARGGIVRRVLLEITALGAALDEAQKAAINRRIAALTLRD